MPLLLLDHSRHRQGSHRGRSRPWSHPFLCSLGCWSLVPQLRPRAALHCSPPFQPGVFWCWWLEPHLCHNSCGSPGAASVFPTQPCSAHSACSDRVSLGWAMSPALAGRRGWAGQCEAGRAQPQRAWRCQTLHEEKKALPGPCAGEAGGRAGDDGGSGPDSRDRAGGSAGADGRDRAGGSDPSNLFPESTCILEQ